MDETGAARDVPFDVDHMLLPGPLLSGAWGTTDYFPARSLQTYVGENKAAKIGDISAGHLSFEVR